MMDRITLGIIYLAGLALAEGLRLQRRITRIRNRQDWITSKNRPPSIEFLILFFVILGFWLLPALYIFSDWLQPLDYGLPPWAGYPALGIFILSLSIRTAAQLTLAGSWSCTLETSRKHHLVQKGIYSFSRHPIYLSLIFWAAAQSLLLQNYLAGLAAWIPVLLIWLVRVPREENMLRDYFGNQYLEYTRRTGRFFPRPPAN